MSGGIETTLAKLSRERLVSLQDRTWEQIAEVRSELAAIDGIPDVTGSELEPKWIERREYLERRRSGLASLLDALFREINSRPSPYADLGDGAEEYDDTPY